MGNLKEQFEEPINRMVIVLFKFIDEQKKELKTKNNIIKAIQEFSSFVNIPKEYSLYLYELYALNYRKDGDYSNLTKENFIDPRSRSGKKTPNTKSHLYTIAQLPFKGSNLEAYWKEDTKGVPLYIVVSYRWYPIYIFKEGKWYRVSDPYSSSTSRQIRNSGPNWSDEIKSQVYSLTPDEMRMLSQGYSHEEVMGYKLQKLKTDYSKLISDKFRFITIWYPKVKIKYKIDSFDFQNEKIVINVSIYDVYPVGRNGGKIEGNYNYLNGEIERVNKEFIEKSLRRGIVRLDLSPHMTNYEYSDNMSLGNIKFEFNFNHIKENS